MIKLLYDTTINGFRVLKGSIIDLDTATEEQLIAEGDATRNVLFDTTNLLPKRIYQSHAPITITSDGTANDQAYRNSGSFVVPGGTMNLNGELVIVASYDGTPDAAAGTRSINLLWGATNVGAPSFASGATQRSIEIQVRIKNCNSLTNQKVHNATSFGVAGSVHIATTKDTTGDITFQTQGKWSAAGAGETIVCVGLSCWYYPGPT